MSTIIHLEKKVPLSKVPLKMTLSNTQHRLQCIAFLTFKHTDTHLRCDIIYFTVSDTYIVKCTYLLNYNGTLGFILPD
uniref:Uncharacterized protein n=1 Tax=Anguilla anguilla TaxID=7936 RepID=A0A0E9UUM2_ANGAN